MNAEEGPTQDEESSHLVLARIDLLTSRIDSAERRRGFWYLEANKYGWKIKIFTNAPFDKLKYGMVLFINNLI